MRIGLTLLATTLLLGIAGSASAQSNDTPTVPCCKPMVTWACGDTTSTTRTCIHFTSEPVDMHIEVQGRDHVYYSFAQESTTIPDGTTYSGFVFLGDVAGFSFADTNVALVRFSDEGRQMARLLYLGVDSNWYYWPGSTDFELSFY